MRYLPPLRGPADASVAAVPRQEDGSSRPVEHVRESKQRNCQPARIHKRDNVSDVVGQCGWRQRLTVSMRRCRERIATPPRTSHGSAKRFRQARRPGQTNTGPYEHTTAQRLSQHSNE
jgi:hypothetical protein